MISHHMNRDIWFESQTKKYQEEHENDCPICEYQMVKDSEYASHHGHLVNVMVCESCGHVEHWVVDCGKMLGGE